MNSKDEADMKVARYLFEQGQALLCFALLLGKESFVSSFGLLGGPLVMSPACDCVQQTVGIYRVARCSFKQD